MSVKKFLCDTGLLEKKITKIYAIVDPEFPMGLFFGRILSKLHENEEIGPREGAASNILLCRSATSADLPVTQVHTAAKL